MTARLSEYEERIVGFVESHGCFVTAVFDPDGVEPNFAYSVGVPATLGQADVLVSGLDLDLMHTLINDVYALCRDGLRMGEMERSDQILSGRECVFREVVPQNLTTEFWNSAIWFQEKYRGERFTAAFQMVWPDNSGKFPWEDGFDESTGAGQLRLWEGGSIQ